MIWLFGDLLRRSDFQLYELYKLDKLDKLSHFRTNFVPLQSVLERVWFVSFSDDICLFTSAI